jgi:uncharacterized protein YecT (DUF1311 family)
MVLAGAFARKDQSADAASGYGVIMSSVYRTARELVERRRGDMLAWLKEHAAECFEEQSHLDEGSRERTYWHYGYLVALNDVLRLVDRDGWG